jgi:SAM-dependent methyltransferase
MIGAMSTNPTIETYDKYSQVYDNEVIGFWDNFPKDFVDSFVRQLPGKRVLNLGSGSGRDAVLLRNRGLEVVCLDASKAMTDITTNLGFESYNADFSHMDFTEASFDGVWAYTSLIHIRQEVVWHNDSPVWTCLYGGGMTDGYMNEGLAGETFAFLKKALSQKEVEFQPRGPKSFKLDGWEYQNDMHGDITSFNGHEFISHNGETIFTHNFFGGVVIGQDAS